MIISDNHCLFFDLWIRFLFFAGAVISGVVVGVVRPPFGAVLVCMFNWSFFSGLVVGVVAFGVVIGAIVLGVVVGAVVPGVGAIFIRFRRIQ